MTGGIAQLALRGQFDDYIFNNPQISFYKFVYKRNTKASAIPEGVSDSEKRMITEDRIIEMAWEDRTPFDAIKAQFGCSEAQVIALMRKQLKRSSFNLWRKRVNSGVSIKHQKLRNEAVQRFHCSRQKSISNNKISKR